MEKTKRKVELKRRVLAFLIDHLIIAGILTSIFLYYTFNNFSDRFIENFNRMMVAGFFLYAIKDIIYGQSIGKRIFKIYVRDNHNHALLPRGYKLIVRNLFSYIWPIELIVLIIKGRKLGDIIAKTDVVEIR